MSQDQLSKQEFERYSRHIIIPEFNLEGQQKLRSSRVLVIGAGGLGCPILCYLTAAGVGTIGIVDFDQISISNLQRQVLYQESQVGQKKVVVAIDRLRLQNPHVAFVPYDVVLTSENALEIINDYDIVIDGTDNFPTRYLVNDACVILDKPLIYGSIFQFEGQVSVFNLKQGERRGPNYRDLFPDPPPPDLVPNCAEGGVLGVLPGIIGSLQASEAIKVLTGIGDPLSGRLFVFDALTFTSVTLNVAVNPDLPAINELIDYEEFCGIPVSSQLEEQVSQISVQEFKRWMNEEKDFQLIDVRNTYEYDIANLDGLLIPLPELSERYQEIKRSGQVIIHCRSGKRSTDAILWLQQEKGFENLLNLKGGILAFAEEIDPEIPKY